LTQEPPVQPNALQPASTNLPPAPEADAPPNQPDAAPDAGHPAPQEKTNGNPTALELLDADGPLPDGLQAPTEATSNAPADPAPTPAPTPDDAPARREQVAPAAN